MYKRSILFFTENAWAFGQIHNALIKRLWTLGIYAHILDWRIGYSKLEMEYLKQKFDLFYTNPPQVPYLLNVFGVPPERIVSVAHAEVDIHKAIQWGGHAMFDGLKSFGVIHPSLVDASSAFGVKRVPEVVLNGIDFDHFYAPVSDSLKTVGYAGAIAHEMSNGLDCKRKHLVPLAMAGLPFEFKDHNFMHHLCMAAFYTHINALLLPSSYEACGLPIMEAAAAGRLVLCGKVGYFDGAFGELVRLPDEEWISDVKLALLKHRDPTVYREACEWSQQYARDHFDWEHRVNAWANLIY